MKCAPGNAEPLYRERWRLGVPGRREGFPVLARKLFPHPPVFRYDVRMQHKDKGIAELLVLYVQYRRKWPSREGGRS
jgi:hypothetical protein